MLNRNNAIVAIVILLLLTQGGVITLPDNPFLPTTGKPIDLPGFNILVLTERSESGPVDEAVTTAAEWRDYVDKHCDEYHAWDDSHTDFKYVSAEWKAAYDKAIADSAGVRPWVLISGKGGTSAALPKSPTESVSLAKRYQP